MYDVFWEDKDGSLTFQYYENKVFAHAKVHVWNKRVYLKCLNTWYVAMEELRERGYTEVFVCLHFEKKKVIKFVKMFGFQPITEIDNHLLLVCSTEN